MPKTICRKAESPVRQGNGESMCAHQFALLYILFFDEVSRQTAALEIRVPLFEVCINNCAISVGEAAG